MDIKKSKEILVAFNLAGIVEIITQEEFEDVKQAIETVLEELENKQDDINILQAQRDSIEYQFKQAKAELEKKNKIINEMAEYISKTDSTMFYNKLNVIQEFEYVVEGRR